MPAEKIEIFEPGNSKPILSAVNLAASKSLTKPFHFKCVMRRGALHASGLQSVSGSISNSGLCIVHLGISLCSMSLEASGLEDCHQAAMAEGSLGHKVDSLFLVEKPETLVRL